MNNYNYTFIFQNSLTYDCIAINAVNVSADNSLYHFNIDFSDFKAGDYKYLLFYNPNEYSVTINNNNLFESTLEDGTIISTLCPDSNIIQITSNELNNPKPKYENNIIYTSYE